MGRKKNVTPVAFKQVIGVEIEALRKQNDLKLRELSEMMEIHLSAFSRFKNGSDECSLFTFFKLHSSLGADPIPALKSLWERYEAGEFDEDK